MNKKTTLEKENCLVPYELVQLLFDIDERDEQFCRFLMKSANGTVEKFLDRNLAERFYLERVQADTGVLIVRHYPIVDVVCVTDYLSGNKVTPKQTSIDYESNLVMLPENCGKRVFDIEYCAGYDADTVPAPIVEAVTKLFVHKRQSFLDMQTAGTKTKETKVKISTAIPDDIKELLIPYQRKRL